MAIEHLRKVVVLDVTGQDLEHGLMKDLDLGLKRITVAGGANRTMRVKRQHRLKHADEARLACFHQP